MGRLIEAQIIAAVFNLTIDKILYIYIYITILNAIIYRYIEIHCIYKYIYIYSMTYLCASVFTNVAIFLLF